MILLTATPVNNTVFDLYHQVRLITRDQPRALLVAGIPDLWEYFRRAEENRDALYEVLEALAVRRSRPFIRQNYPRGRDRWAEDPLPERELRTVRYSLKGHLRAGPLPEDRFHYREPAPRPLPGGDLPEGTDRGAQALGQSHFSA